MNRRTCRDKALSLVELLVVLAIGVLLVVLLVPAVRSAQEMSRRAACLSNLKGIYTAMSSYRADNQMAWPSFKVDSSSSYGGSDTWPVQLLSYGAGKTMYRCPSATHNQSKEWRERELGVSWYGDYAYNRDEYGRNAAWTDAPVKHPGGVFALENPSQSVLMIESTVYSFSALGNPNTTPFNYERTDHAQKMNVLLADGHVEWIGPDRYWSFPVDWSKDPYVSSQLKAPTAP